MGDDEKDWQFEYEDWLANMNDGIDLSTIDIGNITVSGHLDDSWYNNYKEYGLWDQLTPPSDISLIAAGEEMLKITKDGFYVRGVKVPQDAKEAEAVYNAFREWQTYQIMSGNS